MVYGPWSLVSPFPIDSTWSLLLSSFADAGIAQLVEHNLAKVGVAGSNPVSRSRKYTPGLWAKCLQSRVFFFYNTGDRNGGDVPHRCEEPLRAVCCVLYLANSISLRFLMPFRNVSAQLILLQRLRATRTRRTRAAWLRHHTVDGASPRVRHGPYPRRGTPRRGAWKPP